MFHDGIDVLGRKCCTWNEYFIIHDRKVNSLSTLFLDMKIQPWLQFPCRLWDVAEVLLLFVTVQGSYGNEHRLIPEKVSGVFGVFFPLAKHRSRVVAISVAHKERICHGPRCCWIVEVSIYIDDVFNDS